MVDRLCGSKVPAIVGGNTAYVGFTAATGGLTAVQKILTWSFTPAPSTPVDIGDVIVLGSEGGPDVRSRVKVIDPTNDAVIVKFSPYGDDFHGGVRVAVADLDRDGELDIITAPGPRIPGIIKVFDLHGNEKSLSA